MKKLLTILILFVAINLSAQDCKDTIAKLNQTIQEQKELIFVQKKINRIYEKEIKNNKEIINNKKRFCFVNKKN